MDFPLHFTDLTGVYGKLPLVAVRSVQFRKNFNAHHRYTSLSRIALLFFSHTTKRKALQINNVWNKIFMLKYFDSIRQF